MPPPAPPPPYGVDPLLHYQRYWATYLQDHPFETRGFVNGSDEAVEDKERWLQRGKDIMVKVKKVESLLESEGLERTEAEQMELFRSLSAENDAAKAELQEAVKEAHEFLEELRNLYRNVAGEYIQI
jgi:hypothetical protein